MPLGTLQYITLCASVFLNELTLGVNKDDSNVRLRRIQIVKMII